MSSPKNVIYSTIWQPGWPPVLKSTVLSAEDSAVLDVKHGREFVGLLYFGAVTGAVVVTISAQTTPDGSVYTELESVAFTPVAAGLYYVRVSADAFPDGHDRIKFVLSATGGTSFTISSIFLIDKLEVQPSVLHNDGSGTGLLEDDSNGLARKLMEVLS